MKNKSILMFAFLIVFALAANSASAQITINIPDIPKIPKFKKKKSEPQPTPQPETPATTGNSQSNNNQSESNRTSKESGTQQEEQPDECQSNPIARLVEDEVTKMSEDIGGYTPDRGWLYRGSPTYNYLLFSVSPSAKQEWDKKFNLLRCPKIAAGFEKLSVVAAKKLPLRVPNKADYPNRNPAQENMMKSKINDSANHKIHHIGIKQANWLIDKNSIGIPTARYKHGRVWVRYVKDDHPYCRTYFINIIQDYAGGGTYGAAYAKFVDEGLVGCPTGAK